MAQRFLIMFMIFISLTLCGQEKTLYVMVTVDWEGYSLAEKNIETMEAFAKEFPDVPVLHYLNAAYFTKPGADPATVEATIKRALKPNDEHGLHIHGWEKLFAAAGVTPNHEPMWYTDKHSHTKADCEYDCGHEIPINSFTEEELRKVISFSIETFLENGFDRPVSFRSGGWMMSREIIDALAEEGLTTSSGVVPPVLLREKLSRYKLYSWISDYYPEATTLDQPFFWETEHNYLLELPDNACLADYVNAPQMIYIMHEHIDALKQSDDPFRLMVMGYHQESATKYIDNVRGFINYVKEYNKTADIPVKFIVSPYQSLPVKSFENHFPHIDHPPVKDFFAGENQNLFIPDYHNLYKTNHVVIIHQPIVR